jgi:HAD superfamily hydrolase (TIGR01509 family)
LRCAEAPERVRPCHLRLRRHAGRQPDHQCAGACDRSARLDHPPDFEAQYREALLAAFQKELKVVPHVPEVLARIGVPCGVATSSSPRRAEMALALAGPSALVEKRLFASTMVARGKPAPDLFPFAAASMGARPGRTLVTEDSLTGIRAGLAAGMTVWRFVGGSHLGPDAPPEPEDSRPHRRLVLFAHAPTWGDIETADKPITNRDADIS